MLPLPAEALSPQTGAETAVWGIADSPATCEEVFRFRYSQYFAETHHLPGVDHARQRVCLPHDAASTHFYVRGQHGEIMAVGTATAANAPHIVPVWQSIFQLDRLQALDLQRVVIISRLVVLPAQRNSSFVGHFFVHLLKHCVQQGYRYAVHYCTPSMMPFYERLGYRQYGQAMNLAPVHDPDAVGPLRIPLILVPFDGDHLQRVRSLFREVPAGPPEDMARLDRVLPELAFPSLCAQSTNQRLQRLRALFGTPPGTSPDSLPDTPFGTSCDRAEARRAIPDSAASLLRRAALLGLRQGQSLCLAEDPEGVVFVVSGRLGCSLSPGTETPAGTGAFVRTGNGVTVRAQTDCQLLVLHNFALPAQLDGGIGHENCWEKLVHIH